MWRRRRLHHAATAGGTGIARPARHDHPEPRRDDVEAFRYVLADLDPLGGAASAARRRLRLDHDLDPLEMGRQLLARPRCAGLRRLGCRVQRRLDRAEAGLDLFEGELMLIGIERFRSPPVTCPFERLEQGVAGARCGSPLRAWLPAACRLGRNRRRLGARRRAPSPSASRRHPEARPRHRPWPTLKHDSSLAAAAKSALSHLAAAIRPTSGDAPRPPSPGSNPCRRPTP